MQHSVQDGCLALTSPNLSPPCARREGRAGRAADVPAAAGRQAGGREQRDLPGEPDQGREG